MSGNFAIVDDQAPAQVQYHGDWGRGAPSEDLFNTTTTFPYFTATTVTFQFVGTSVQPYIMYWGYPKIFMSIDNETFTSTFVAPSDLPDGTLFRHIPLWSDPPSLPDTPHTLLLNITGAINSTTGVWVDYFVYEVSESTPINDTRFFVDDRDSRIQYGDGWKPIDSNDTVMHTLTGSGAAGSTLSFTFEGTGISVYGALNQSVNREVVQANFAIDNESSVTYSPQPPSSFKFNNLYFNETNLEPGNHTMKVSTLTDATIWIDYLLVTPINATALASSNSTTSTSFPVPSSTTSPAPDSSNRTHIATGAIVGGVIGGVFGLIAGILLVSFFMRRRRRKQYHDAHYIAPFVPPMENTSRDLDLGVSAVSFRSRPTNKPAQASSSHFPLSKGGYHTHAAPSTGTISAPAESPGEQANTLPEAPNNDEPYLDSGIRFPDRPPPNYTAE